MITEGIQLGRRVWVADAVRAEGRICGHIASFPQVFLNGHASFVVMLDAGKPTAVTCCVERRGRQWDFAEEEDDVLPSSPSGRPPIAGKPSSE
jgi:hypothetical protein